MCWKTDNKTCLIYVLRNQLQVRADCRKKKSQSVKLDRSRIRPDRSRIAEKEILQNFKSGSSPQKHLGFHSNLSTYKRKTLVLFWRLLEDFGGALVRSKRYCAFLFQSHYRKSFTYH